MGESAEKDAARNCVTEGGLHCLHWPETGGNYCCRCDHDARMENRKLALRQDSRNLPAEPQAMTLSHDRLVLQRAEEHGGQVVVVRCPHMVGLAFELDEPENFLGLLPCPCNDRSEVVARVVPAQCRPFCVFDKGHGGECSASSVPPGAAS